MATPPPIRFEESRGCNGAVRLGHPAAVCVPCLRRGVSGPKVEPMARRGADGVTRCPNQLLEDPAGLLRRPAAGG